jgi:hypothetical protein
MRERSSGSCGEGKELGTRVLSLTSVGNGASDKGVPPKSFSTKGRQRPHSTRAVQHERKKKSPALRCRESQRAVELMCHQTAIVPKLAFIPRLLPLAFLVLHAPLIPDAVCNRVPGALLVCAFRRVWSTRPLAESPCFSFSRLASPPVIRLPSSHPALTPNELCGRGMGRWMLPLWLSICGRLPLHPSSSASASTRLRG